MDQDNGSKIRNGSRDHNAFGYNYFSTLETEGGRYSSKNGSVDKLPTSFQQPNSNGNDLNPQGSARSFQQYEEQHKQYKQMMETFKKDNYSNLSMRSASRSSKKSNSENEPFAHSEVNKQKPKDEKPIQGPGKTFDEILEENMDQMRPQKTNENKKPPVKRSFLKRSEKSSLPVQTKKYSYYASNFDQPKPQDTHIVVEKPKATSSSVVRPQKTESFKPVIKPSKPAYKSEKESDGYNSMEEFEKLEEECIKEIHDKKGKAQTAMQMIDQRAQDRKWHSKKKLFDDSDSESEEEDKEEDDRPTSTANKGQMSGVVK